MGDLRLLPARPLIDTGVFIRGFGQAPSDSSTAACRDLVDALLQQGRTILLAAPSLAEAIRKTGKPIPRVRGVEVVAFDDRAALYLGQTFPIDVLKEEKTAAGRSFNSVKYDALIVACAGRHKADCIVTLDNRMASFAQRLAPPIVSKRPEDFQQQAQAVVGLPATLAHPAR